MADGRHLGFRFWAVISASINIFAPNFVPRWKIGSPRGPSAQKLGFRKFKMADGRHLGFRFSAIISASINIFAPNFVSRWNMGSPMGSRSRKIGSPTGPSAQKSDFRKSKMADGRHLGFRFWAVISASLKIIAPNLVHDEKSIAQKSLLRNQVLKIQDGGRHVKFQKVIIIQSWSEICDM